MKEISGNVKVISKIDSDGKRVMGILRAHAPGTKTPDTEKVCFYDEMETLHNSEDILVHETSQKL